MPDLNVPVESEWRLTLVRGLLTLRSLLNLRGPRQRAEDEAYEYALLAGLTYDLEKLQ
ncbi:MAG TPA: hypothetical protein VIL32_07010 [Steroidobacteraceae bacterium]